jgi:hypothetical protein
MGERNSYLLHSGPEDLALCIFSVDFIFSFARHIFLQKEYSHATGEFEFFPDTDKPDRYYEMMIQVSRGIKELQAMVKEMKTQRLRSHE